MFFSLEIIIPCFRSHLRYSLIAGDRPRHRLAQVRRDPVQNSRRNWQGSLSYSRRYRRDRFFDQFRLRGGQRVHVGHSRRQSGLQSANGRLHHGPRTHHRRERILSQVHSTGVPYGRVGKRRSWHVRGPGSGNRSGRGRRWKSLLPVRRLVQRPRLLDRLRDRDNSCLAKIRP